ncbi:MAPEG family protein [Pseudobacteriovorax antillogorgiicola]|uniref:MAPEG family protein n=1 Tax=Pseudobacteriovorax antillogorgiicola TaxID=1513793 RepID=A0A1Y6BG62_9BACT|nr:MAPEG family protein [Pseudobacteriovorax antillogorgiicola]TCS56392.1 hypothetical protein EDD56_104214 [Pseudobacteriovorax antillogorgiicola]SMF06173.1 hypothetical protein SAMN06296036_104119 [Pseudobacteriovorax antillogorgiicola]
MVYPIFAMVSLFFVVLLYGLVIRIKAVKQGTVHGHYFKTFEARAAIPEKIVQHKNHIENLSQAPILFYVACVVAMIQTYDDTMIILAWLYVALRIVHSIIHLSYNNVIHRLSAFLASNVVLVVLWLRLL